MRHHFSSKMYSSPVLLPSQYRALTFPFWLFGNDIFIYLPAQAMGMFFRRDVVVRSRFQEFQAAMRSAFLKVRDDVSLAAQWIQYLHAELEGQKGRHNDAGRRMDSLSSQLAAITDKLSRQQQAIMALSGRIDSAPTRAELRDQHFLLENASGGIDALSSKVKELASMESLRKAEEKVSALSDALRDVPSRGDIRRMIDEQFEQEDIIRRLDALEEKLKSRHEEALAAPADAPSGIIDLSRRLERLEEKRSSLKEKMLKKITRNSKEYVKSLIISMIKKYGKVSALQLKEMIVEEQGLCSKSSFYRLLEELEERDDISAVRSGKEKHYLAKQQGIAQER